MFLLLTYWTIAGITAKDLLPVYHQLENSSRCLHVRNPPPYDNPEWQLRGTIITDKHKLNPKFKNKVDYNPENHTLCFKHLSVRDNGVYEFSFSFNFTKSLERYKIIVQEMVPTPVIATSVLDANASAGVCKISVNCSVQRDWLRSLCDANGCRTTEESLNEVSISVATDNHTLVCSGNNSVSASSASKSMTAACFSLYRVEVKEPPQPPLVIVTALVLGLCLLTFSIFAVRKLLSEKSDQTTTAQLIPNQQADPQTDPRTSSSSQADASYENVNTLPPSQGSRITEGQVVVDTIYSVLQPTKANLTYREGDDGKLTGGPQNTHEAPTPPCLTRDGAEQPVYADTVYSMLQNPQ